MDGFKSGITLHCFMNKFMFIKPTQIEEHKNDDYHIYLICSLPKAYFVEESINITSRNLTCEIIYNNEKVKIDNCYLKLFESKKITGTTFKLSNDRSTITISYYINFEKQDDIVFSANEIYGASGLMKVKKEKILYIGQGFGKGGKRTAGARLESHSTLQTILSDIQCNGGDEEVQLYLMNFRMEHMLQLFGETDITDSKKIAKNFFDTRNDYNQGMCINLVEASLINYFKPEYNIQYKDKIFSSSSPKFKIFYKNNISSISVQMLPTSYEDNYFDDGVSLILPQIIFYTNDAEYDTKSNSFITSELDQNLYSTYAKLKTY